MKQKIHQQGDVILKPLSNLPEGAVKAKVQDGIVAEGEQTGHAHAFPVGAAVLLVLGSRRFWEAALLKHQEHHRQLVGPGLYEQNAVLEYDHFKEEARAVPD